MESTDGVSCFICVFSYIIHYSQAITYYIPEEQLPGTSVGNIGNDFSISSRASDVELNEMEYYFASESDIMKHFMINISTSQLTINEKIDREQICPFSKEFACPLMIEVFAKSVNSFLEKIEVTIYIEDINDNAPYFPVDSFDLEIPESDLPGTPFDLDVALDRDSSNFSVKMYTIFPAQIFFKIQQKDDDGTLSLQLVIDAELDRETDDHYSLQLIASDGGFEPLTGTMMLNISVLDANDNKPVFTKSVYEVNVKENIAVNTTIIQVSAKDADLGPNAEVSYSLSDLQSEDMKNSFAVNEVTGEVKVIGQLEYTQGKIYEIAVKATDHGQRPQSSQVIVKVTVEDSENNAPEIDINVFSPSGNAEVSEFESVASVVAYVKVTDRDKGRNGNTSCELVHHFFGLQSWKPNEYKVIILNTLNREEIATHTVTVTCKDKGIPSLSSVASFNVTVLDENDNAPVFTSERYTSSVEENNPTGYTVVQVQAKDADLGKNGKVSYYLNLTDRTDFSINAQTGLITAARPFDRENASNYEFPVFAVDAGSPQGSSSAIVFVSIGDVNDNDPTFKKDFTYYVPESNFKETVLDKVSAEDIDDDLNGYVTYRLDKESEDLPFQILPDGTVKTQGILDREAKDKYEFVVVATDNGVDERRSGSASVTVYVTDINDHHPVITYPRPDLHVVNYVTYMAPPQTQVLKIEASDKDEGNYAKLSYKIDKRNDSNIFKIGGNGEIIVARKMYDTDVDWYSLGIVVSDQGIPPKTDFTNVTIVVLTKDTKNLTGLTPGSAAESLDNQNVIIAVVVVVVTVVMAATILLVIWIVRRLDQKKQKYLENNNTSPPGSAGGSPKLASDVGRKTSDFSGLYDGPMVPRPPIITNPSIEKTNGKSKDVIYENDIQFRENGHISMDSTDSTTKHNNQQLHRLASLRLQQAFIQNKPANGQNEFCDTQKKQEDVHSDLSADTGTFDSGMGGSVSDTGDLRLVHLQQVVRQSGRQGKPPHKCQPIPDKPPRVSARGRNEAPERPPPCLDNPFKTKSPVPLNSVHFSKAGSPIHFMSPSPTNFTASSPVHFEMNKYDSYDNFPSNNHKFSSNGPQKSTTSPTKFLLNSPDGYLSTSPPKFTHRHSPTKNVVQDLLMYKKFQNGLKPANGRIPIEESIDTTHFDDDESTTSGSYYIENTVDDLLHPPVSNIYV